MNCPSRTDNTLTHDGWNQNPHALASDLTTRQDLNGIANSRTYRDHRASDGDIEAEIRSHRVTEQTTENTNDVGVGEGGEGVTGPPRSTTPVMPHRSPWHHFKFLYSNTLNSKLNYIRDLFKHAR